MRLPTKLAPVLTALLAVDPMSFAIAQGTEEVPSAIGVEYRHYNDVFKGTVESTELVGYNEPGCVRWRQVVVKRARKGRDQVINRDLTNKRGFYRIPYLLANGDPKRSGRFYAKVARKVLEAPDGSTAVCEPARSRTLRLRNP